VEIATYAEGVKILIVGAGAVGQVYGWHLAKAGHEVAALGRPSQAGAAQEGFVLSSLQDAKDRELGRWVPAAFYTGGREVDDSWDQVWLCVGTHALDESWLKPLASRTPSASVVSLQPGTAVRERLSQFWPRQAIIRGVIGMISAGRNGNLGAAFYFPPGVKSQFSAVPKDKARSVVKALRAGGVPAQVVEDADLALAWGSGFLMPNIVTLESVEWSISRLASWSVAALAARAAREAHSLVARRYGRRRPLWSYLIRAPLLMVGWRVGRWVMRFDLEAYLKMHFLKVRPQTREMVASYLRDADKHAISSPALRRLQHDVFETS
jgi:2-dehydropantoate 2-reductase